MRALSRGRCGGKKVAIIIEHLEPVLAEWIWLEYRHVSKMVGRENLLLANVKGQKESSKLKEIGEVTRRSVVELQKLYGASMIVLDPQSSQLLSPEDFHDRKFLVVGGILGDHPARGRTRLAITGKMPETRSRALGTHQFSVDGAVYVAMEVASGRAISDIPVKVGIDLIVNEHLTTHLPFAYPLKKGKPLLAPGLIQYLKRGIVKDEKTLLETGKPRSVA